MKNLIKKTVMPVYMVIFVFCVNAYAFPSLSLPSSFLNEQDSMAVDIELVNSLADDGSLSKLDVYVKILYDNIQFIKVEKDTFLAQYDIEVRTKNKEDDTTQSREFSDSIIIQSLDEANSVKKFNLNKVSFDLNPGEYDILIAVQDKETLFRSEFQRKITLKDFSKPGVQVSNILFLDGVQQNADNSGFVFTPRVSNEQSDDFRILAYFEIYNVAADDSFKIKYQVLGKQDTIWYQHEYFSAGVGRVTQNFIDVVGENLPHGKYRLKVFVESGDGNFDTEKAFNWYLQGLPAAFRSVDEAIDVLKYLATKKEYKRLKKLSTGEKHQEFLAFWKKHDPTPETTENELRDEYYARVVFANDNYHSMSKGGWQTDRGWVYIMLGKPDNIQRNPYNMDFRTRRLGKTIKAIQIWDYYTYSRQLVFYDDNGFGQYRLENPETLYEILKN